jgi:sugar lactone lactonase YvrE
VGHNYGIIGEYNSADGSAIKTNFISGISTPADMTFDNLGNIYVSGFENGYVAQYSKSGELITNDFAAANTFHPLGLAAYSNSLFVADNYTGSIHKFNLADGSDSIVTNNVGYCPDAIRFDTQGNMYVVVWGEGRIAKFSADGTYNASFIEMSDPNDDGGSTPWRPYNIAFDSAGNIYVSGNNKVSKFSSDGTLINKDLLDYTAVYGMAIDSHDHIFVGSLGGVYGDGGSGNIAEFSTNGVLINNNFISNVGEVSSIVVGAVPEPSTCALFGMGTIGMLIVVCRKKKAY